MNAVVQFQPQHAAVPNFSMTDMERVALAIAKGGLFGSSDPNAVLTLCMLAQAEGQHPAVVFRDYHIISGKPAKKSEAMQRDFLMAGGKIEWHQLDDSCVDATFSHPQGGTVRISWDNARVQQAQLGGNPMHKKYPRQMKKARVIAEGVRTVWPSATSGLYETGEVQDIVADTPAAAVPMPVVKRARDLTPEPQPAPALEAPATDWFTLADNTIENIGKAPNLAKLDQFIANRMPKLAGMSEAAPDAWQAIDDTLRLRRAELAPAAEPVTDDDLPDQF